MAVMTLQVNGQARTVDADPECPLLNVLLEKLQMQVGFGCRAGTCGDCTILLDKVRTRICLLPVASAVGHEIDTMEDRWEYVEPPKEFRNW